MKQLKSQEFQAEVLESNGLAAEVTAQGIQVSDMVRPLPDDGPCFGAAFRRIRGKGENCKGGY